MSRAAVAITTTRTFPLSRALREGALPGALAGLVGGVAFGASMVELGQLESIASLVRADTPAVGAVVHAIVAAIVGAAFGLLMLHQRATAVDMLVWGSAYGAFFWFVGPLTLRPLILGDAVLWDIGSAHAFFASLIGHVVWGAVAGLSLTLIRPLFGTGQTSLDASSERQPVLGARRRLRSAAVGGSAGIVSAVVLTALLPARNELTAPVVGTGSTSWFAVIALGLVTGALYGALVPYSTSPASPRLGARLVQGITLGFLAWIAVALTIIPLDQIGTLAWTARLARARFVVFPGYILFGTLTAFVFCAVAGGARFLFSDEIRHADRLTAGPQRLRAVARGALAGIIGGLLFTVVMVEVGALGRVSELVGAESSFTGFFVHMAIAVIIGGTYALVFRRLSFDVRSGLGWGVAYGLLWWILGALTLLPVLLGGEPQWSASEAARAFPSLVGHLAYGMGLGVTFYALETRYNPWWVTRNESEAARALARRAQMLTSAPASWAFVVFVAFFVVMVLARGTG
jgi:uncharacterized membrane protein YagU involved in acid resistance